MLVLGRGLGKRLSSISSAHCRAFGMSCGTIVVCNCFLPLCKWTFHFQTIILISEKIYFNIVHFSDLLGGCRVNERLQICVWERDSRYMPQHIGRGQTTASGIGSSFLPCLRQGLSWLHQENWPKTFWGCSCLYLPSLWKSAGITNMGTTVSSFYSSGDLNSDQKICMAKTLFMHGTPRGCFWCVISTGQYVQLFYLWYESHYEGSLPLVINAYCP